ncbi:hypothetical protein [Dactylosporangium sp. NPDC005555]|uniref:hypothetical protein n=1 Tax=Dactylosporangium sp. NPDC005555 TaxID=3154889 RepID=UPI0033AF7E1E
MVVIYVDGVDGTGKSTLIGQLVRHYPAHLAITAPPLWRYLPSVPTPQAFPTWVTTTPANDIAAELLSAQRNRINDLHALGDHCQIVLVDRGPRTVEASARAHLATKPPPELSEATADLIAELHTAARRLSAVHPCLSIELATTSYDEIIHRLTITERHDAAYLRYLRAFLHEFQSSASTSDPAPLVLRADAHLHQNVTVALRAVQALA